MCNSYCIRVYFLQVIPLVVMFEMRGLHRARASTLLPLRFVGAKREGAVFV